MPDLPFSDDQLARLQAALLAALDERLPPQTVIERLQRDPQFADFAAYLGTFEPRMVEVAIQLVAKWGRRDAGVPATF
jgi:hypothetical protein